MNVTYSNHIAERERKGLLEFRERYKNARIVLLTKELEMTDENGIEYLPLWRWLI